MTVRSALPAVYILVAGATLALALAAIPYIGIAGASPAAGVALVDPALAARPSDALADPLEDLAGAVDDVRREGQAHGWALGAIVGLVLLSRALRRAYRRWPTMTTLRWMAGPAGLVVVGAGIIGSAAFDAFVFGGSWLAAGYAAIGSALYLLDPDLKLSMSVPVPEPQEWPADVAPPLPRLPGQRGSAHLGQLIPIALLGLAAAIALAVTSCSAAGKQATASKAHIVDCTAAAIREHAAAYGARIEASITAATVNGAIDWERVGEAVAELGVEAGIEVAGCAAARTVADLLERPSAAPLDRRQIEDGWAHVQRQHLGGRVYEAAP